MNLDTKDLQRFIAVNKSKNCYELMEAIDTCQNPDGVIGLQSLGGRSALGQNAILKTLFTVLEQMRVSENEMTYTTSCTMKNCLIIGCDSLVEDYGIKSRAIYLIMTNQF